MTTASWFMALDIKGDYLTTHKKKNEPYHSIRAQEAIKPMHLATHIKCIILFKSSNQWRGKIELFLDHLCAETLIRMLRSRKT